MASSVEWGREGGGRKGGGERVEEGGREGRKEGDKWVLMSVWNRRRKSGDERAVSEVES